MKKRIFSLLFALVICVSLSVTVFATEEKECFIYDSAEILTESEHQQLDETLSQLSSTYNAEVVIVTVASADGMDVRELADGLYDKLGIGYGADHDGVMLMLCMDPRQYHIIGKGFAAEAIDASVIENIGESISTDLKSNRFSAAFRIFTDECKYYLDGHLNGFPFKTTKNVLIALVVGLLFAWIITKSWESKLKSVRKQDQANVYVKSGSMNITQSGDFFMYRNITRTQKQSSSSSGSSSGSSRSSGGGSF